MSILGSFLGFLLVAPVLLTACAGLLLEVALVPLNWFCFFSINIGAICLNFVERESLISWNWSLLRRVSSSDMSFDMSFDTMKKDIYVAHVTRHILGIWIILSILQSFTSL